MKVLLWKDCRVNWFVLLLGAALLLAPYVVAVIAWLYTGWQDEFMSWDYTVVTQIGLLSLMASLLTMAMLGGNAFTAERADRSAEFLAYMPPSRWTLAASKIVVALGASLIVWILNLLTILVLAPRLPGAPKLMSTLEDNPYEELPILAGIAVLIFGIAWLCSSFVASPAIATGGGFFSPLLAASVVGSLNYFFHPAGFSFMTWYGRLNLTVGIAAFVVGTVVYVRRVEP